MSNPTPTAFADFDVIEGFDPIDKAELVGKPFGITGVRFRENERKVTFAEVEIVTPDGEPAAFQDSSTTGVRDQLAKYLADKGVKVSADWSDLKLYIPRGLRVSEYDAPVDDTGKTRKAKTYYLTTQGRKRPEVGPAGADRPQRTRSNKAA